MLIDREISILSQRNTQTVLVNDGLVHEVGIAKRSPSGMAVPAMKPGVGGSVALMAKSDAASAGARPQPGACSNAHRAAINQRRRLYHHEGVMMQEAGGV
jgi:hypothetical protein